MNNGRIKLTSPSVPHIEDAIASLRKAMHSLCKVKEDNVVEESKAVSEAFRSLTNRLYYRSGATDGRNSVTQYPESKL